MGLQHWLRTLNRLMCAHAAVLTAARPQLLVSTDAAVRLIVPLLLLLLLHRSMRCLHPLLPHCVAVAVAAVRLRVMLLLVIAAAALPIPVRLQLLLTNGAAEGRFHCYSCCTR